MEDKRNRILSHDRRGVSIRRTDIVAVPDKVKLMVGPRARVEGSDAKGLIQVSGLAWGLEPGELTVVERCWQSGAGLHPGMFLRHEGQLLLVCDFGFVGVDPDSGGELVPLLPIASDGSFWTRDLIFLPAHRCLDILVEEGEIPGPYLVPASDDEGKRLAVGDHVLLYSEYSDAANTLVVHSIAPDGETITVRSGTGSFSVKASKVHRPFAPRDEARLSARQWDDPRGNRIEPGDIVWSGGVQKRAVLMEYGVDVSLERAYREQVNFHGHIGVYPLRPPEGGTVILCDAARAEQPEAHVLRVPRMPISDGVVAPPGPAPAREAMRAQHRASAKDSEPVGPVSVAIYASVRQPEPDPQPALPEESRFAAQQKYYDAMCAPSPLPSAAGYRLLGADPAAPPPAPERVLQQHHAVEVSPVGFVPPSQQVLSPEAMTRVTAIREAWKAFHPTAWLTWDVVHAAEGGRLASIRGEGAVCVGLTFGIEGIGEIARTTRTDKELVGMNVVTRVLRRPTEIASAKMTARYVPSGRVEPPRPRRALVEEFLAGFDKEPTR